MLGVSEGPNTPPRKIQENTIPLPTPSNTSLPSNRCALPSLYPVTKSASLAGCSTLASSVPSRGFY
jgi:hypothetical protein